MKRKDRDRLRREHERMGAARQEEYWKKHRPALSDEENWALGFERKRGRTLRTRDRKKFYAPAERRRGRRPGGC